MPRKKKRSRRRFTGINALTALESYLQASIATDLVVGLTPLQFLGVGVNEAGWAKSGDPHAKRITLEELVKGVQRGSGVSPIDAMWSNIQNGWLQATLSSVALGVGFKFGKKLLARPRRAINKNLKMVGLGSTVKV
jgi:hypothetical protein